MKAKVDPDLCTACELCVGDCPDVYSMGDEVAVAIEGDIPESAQECAKQAAADCPSEAITIEE